MKSNEVSPPVLRARRLHRIDGVFPVRWTLRLGWGCGAACAPCPAPAFVPFDPEAYLEPADEVIRQIPEAWAGIGGGLEEFFLPRPETRTVATRLLSALASRGIRAFLLTKAIDLDHVLPCVLRLPSALRPVLTISFGALNDAMASKGEPGAPLPSRRLALVEALAREGVPVGVHVQPVSASLIPDLGDFARRAKEAGAQFGTWGYLSGKEDEAETLAWEEEIRLRWSEAGLPPRLPLSFLRPSLRSKDFAAVALHRAWEVENWRGRPKDAFRQASLTLLDLDDAEWERRLERADFSGLPGVGPWISGRLASWCIARETDALDEWTASFGRAPDREGGPGKGRPSAARAAY